MTIKYEGLQEGSPGQRVLFKVADHSVADSFTGQPPEILEATIDITFEQAQQIAIARDEKTGGSHDIRVTGIIWQAPAAQGHVRSRIIEPNQL